MNKEFIKIKLDLAGLQKFAAKHKYAIILFSIFLLHLFLRFYQLEERTPFNWDQVNNAWAAKDIIIDHKFPLVGMQAKLNSGVYIGPLYYYFVAIFYFFTNLDPIASGIIAGFTSIITFFTYFFIIKKIFNYKVALFALFINTVSYHIIAGDRAPWPVNFIAPISLIIFFALYKILTGKEKYLIILAIGLGLSFNVHFTSIFYPIIILFTFPFFPRTKETLKFLLFSITAFIPFIVPQLIAQMQTQISSSKTFVNYLSSYSHGFHLVRFFQIAQDAFIEFDAILIDRISFLIFFKPIKYVLLPLFILILMLKKRSKENLILAYLLILWFIIPWFVFSIYSGEISNYYFYITRPLVIIIISYLIVKTLSINNAYLKCAVLLAIVLYSFVNIQNFIKDNYSESSLKYFRTRTLQAIKEKRKVEFQEGVPDSYIYYIYKQR